jgi:hypothetical protein
MSEYNENKQPVGLTETLVVNDNDVIVQKVGETFVKKVKKSNLSITAENVVISFELEDWEADGENYSISIEHDLGCSFPVVELREDDLIVNIHRVETIDQDIIKLVIPSDPDLRFDGTVSIIKTSL